MRAEIVPGGAKESAAARKSGSVTFAAEVAEKSGATLSVSRSGFAALPCPCDTLTTPSSKNADTNKLFMMRLSEGCPTPGISHTATVNNTKAFVHALSRQRGKKKTVRRSLGIDGVLRKRAL